MNLTASGTPVEALNFHVWQPCNMACRYCFAEFRDAVPTLRADKEHLRDRALSVIAQSADAGVSKLTLVGGEPTLCPWLDDLLTLAKARGMTTMVVSNGSRMDDVWLEQHLPLLDWVALSVDSLFPEVNRKIGRQVGSRAAPGEEHYTALFQRLQQAGVRLKVNTVVSALNWREDFNDFILRVLPERWKVLQALHIRGENDAAFPAFAVSPEQFSAFVARHRATESTLTLAAEDNEAMTGSYLMVDPLGRFFTNWNGVQRYSSPIWQVGWDTALAEVVVSRARFLARGGRYAWASTRTQE
jgi:radical S-adenosyl methionine domain-containing protein 2